MAGSRGEARVGIIPARAGFTSSRTGTMALSSDHPRSRGVYDRQDRLVALGSGSSPLARGLPGQEGQEPSARGIIPARAGFTLHHLDGRARARDHPRSRGVYGQLRLSHGDLSGSSPLARGLHRPGRSTCRWPGIIPARAGFTARGPRRGAGCRDHPRSRGVYSASSPSRTGTRGSSPLARGLPLV